MAVCLAELLSEWVCVDDATHAVSGERMSLDIALTLVFQEPSLHVL